MTKGFLYIRDKRTDILQIDLRSLAYTICQCVCSVLVIYFFWYVEAFGNWSLVVNSSFLIMCGCVFIIWISGMDETQRFRVPYGVWNSLLMVAYCIIPGLMIAYDQSILLQSVRQYFIYFIIIYAVCLISNKKGSFNWLLYSINVATLICCVHLMGWGHAYSASRIVLSPNSNPNLLGTILNIGLFAVLYRTSIKFKSIMFNFPQIVLLLYNIVMTGSRKSFIAAVALVAIWGYSAFSQTMKSGSKKQKIVMITILICGLVFSIYYYKSFVMNTALFDRMQTMGDEESNGTRIWLYKKAFEIFLNKPLFGGGLHQYQFWSGSGGYSHSTFAEAISDFGLIGSFLYFAPFVSAIIGSFLLAYKEKCDFQSRLILGLCIVEIFWGVGQIWFMDISHFIAWTIIFLYVDSNKSISLNKSSESVGKYVKY